MDIFALVHALTPPRAVWILLCYPFVPCFKVQISDYIHNALDILDRDLVDVKITYIRTAMYQLLHTDNLGFADLD